MKQVIIIRKDLNMRKGKIAAQASHASMKAILNEAKPVEKDDDELVIPLSHEMAEWLSGIFTKICVGVNSESELLDIYNQAVAKNIHCSLIQDCGLTEFNNIPTYTAVAIGPGDPTILNEITGDLKLL